MSRLDTEFDRFGGWLLVKVQKAHVYVASEFGGWQARVLRWLAQHYDEVTNSFAKEASSGVIDEVRSSPSFETLLAETIVH